MKKHIQLFSVLLALLLLVGAFAACGKEDKNSYNAAPDITNEAQNADKNDKTADDAANFIGTWQEIDENGNLESEKMILTADGAYMAADTTGRGLFGEWNTVGSKFTFKATMNGQAADFTGTYVFSNDTVKLTYDDGDIDIYKKIGKMSQGSVDGSDAKLTGLWQEVDENGNLKSEKMVLASDGTGMAIDTSGNGAYIEWGADGSRVSLIMTMGNQSAEFTGTYKISGDTLTFTYDDGDVDIYEKINN